MSDIHLFVDILVARDVGGHDIITPYCRREYKLPIRKAVLAQAWGTRYFNIALAAAQTNEVVTVEITGNSDDASHHLATGRMFGWSGKVQSRKGVFEK